MARYNGNLKIFGPTGMTILLKQSFHCKSKLSTISNNLASYYRPLLDSNYTDTDTLLAKAPAEGAGLVVEVDGGILEVGNIAPDIKSLTLAVVVPRNSR
jgi:hypothetical protein